MAGQPFSHGLGPDVLASEGEPVTRSLYDRLDEADVEAALEQMAGSQEFRASGLDARDPQLHRWLTLAYGIWLEVPAVAEKTGLPAAQPPADVHAMARGPLAAAGGLYEADLVVNSLRSVGADLHDGQSVLDFGCSSGRVLRVLAAYRPNLRYLGCDPNEAAVRWAQQALPGIKFFCSPQHPPLKELSEHSLDIVCAISIWSHFAPELGLLWFAEMHRVLRPGGHLIITTHGLQSIAYYSSRGMRSAAQSSEIQGALYRDGFWYGAEFGPAGDWGVVNPSWGTAFFSPEWVLTKLCPEWRVLEFASGRNQENQDVYVLQRA